MPHVVLAGKLALGGVSLDPTVHRWGRVVIKTGDWWLRWDARALLIEGVVVEFSRPLHPVAVVAHHRGDTVVRLWSVVAVERTRAVQRWLCILAAAIQGLGAGPVKVTNIPSELWSDLDLSVTPELKVDEELDTDEH
jgi:hypothetical protein